MIIRCPVCSGSLERRGGSYFCASGHCYDISKYGYVNLLMSNSSSAKRHGDDRLMVSARRDFFERGYYEPIRSAVSDAVLSRVSDSVSVLDAGCGEGWYLEGLCSEAKKRGIELSVCGIDISRDALRFAAKRLPGAEFAVASSAHMPVSDEACEVVMNIFSPLEEKEFHRILAPNGLLVRVVPLERHLWSLKAAIYERPYENDAPETELNGFRLIERNDVKTVIDLVCREDVENLFSMTPYYYKTSESDQARLASLTRLQTEAEVAVLSYTKK